MQYGCLVTKRPFNGRSLHQPIDVRQDLAKHGRGQKSDLEMLEVTAYNILTPGDVLRKFVSGLANNGFA